MATDLTLLFNKRHIVPELPQYMEDIARRHAPKPPVYTIIKRLEAEGFEVKRKRAKQ